MVIDTKLRDKNLHLKEKAEKIKVILTDVDGVLTDTGIYYGKDGEAFKRFSIRDGMGVERLQKYAGIETIIVTGENSNTVKTRAEKLKMKEFYLGVNKKEESYKLGEYLFDPLKQQLVYRDKSIKLTTKESELLELLCRHGNEILERNFALKSIWIDDNYFNARSMDVYITRLRKYLMKDVSVKILNVHGKGYKLIC